MEVSILIAKILSIIYLSTGIGILIKTVDFNKIIEGFEKSPTLSFLGGCFGIIIGSFLIKFHNIWENDWTVIITVISWLFFIGGIIVVIFPKSLSIGKGLINNSTLLGSLMIVIGLIFGYFGFLN